MSASSPCQGIFLRRGPQLYVAKLGCIARGFGCIARGATVLVPCPTDSELMSTQARAAHCTAPLLTSCCISQSKFASFLLWRPPGAANKWPSFSVPASICVRECGSQAASIFSAAGRLYSIATVHVFGTVFCSHHFHLIVREHILQQVK